MFAFTLRMLRYGSRLALHHRGAPGQVARRSPADGIESLNEQELVTRMQNLIGMVDEVELCNLQTQVLMMAHHGISRAN